MVMKSALRRVRDLFSFPVQVGPEKFDAIVGFGRVKNGLPIGRPGREITAALMKVCDVQEQNPALVTVEVRKFTQA
jgi:hypothetical protein